jgi:cellulose synthase operon protein C
MFEWIWRRLFGDLSEPRREIVHPLEMAVKLERKAAPPATEHPATAPAAAGHAATPTAAPGSDQKGLRDIRRVNVRLIVVLVIFAGVFGASIHFVHGWQVDRLAHSLYRRALVEKEQNNLQKAVSHLQIYVGYRPHDAAALADLGLMLSDLANSSRQKFRAFQVLSNALRRDETRHDVRRRLVGLAIDLGRYRDAESILEPLDPRKATNDVELQLLAARAAEGLERFQDAERYYLNAIAGDPTGFEAYLRLARLLRVRIRRPRAAVQIIEALVIANPDNYEAHLHKTRELLLEGDLDLAAAALARAEALAPPGDLDVALMSANLFAGGAGARLDADSVRRRLVDLLESRPKESRLYQALSIVEESIGAPAAAEEWLNRGLRQLPEDHALAESYVIFLIRHERPSEARKALDRLEKSTFYSADLALVHGVRQVIDFLEERNWLVARRRLEDMSKQAEPNWAFLPQVESWLLLCYQRLNETERELALTRRMWERNPGSGEVLRARAAALARQGNIEGALEVLARDSAPRSRLTRAALLIDRNLRLPEVRQDWDSVERLLTQVDGDLRPDAMALKIGMLAERRRLDEAIDLAAQTREARPGEERWLLLEAELWQRQGDHARALALLDSAPPAVASPQLLRAQIEYWLRRGAAAPPELLQEVETRLPDFAPDDQPLLAERLVQACRAANDAAAVSRTVSLRARLQPNNLRVLLDLFEHGSAEGDFSLIAQALEGLTRIDGADGPYAASCRLLWESLKISETDKKQEALKQELRRLCEKHPRIPLVWVNLARLEEHLGQQPAALEHYQTALDAGLDDTAVIEHLVRSYYALQRYAEANRVLDLYQTRTGKSERSPASLMQTGLLLESGQTAGAFSMAQSRALRNPHDYNSLVWLGMTASAAKRNEDAEKAFRDAIAIDPRAASAWVALVRHLAVASKPAEAVAAVKQAAEKIAPAEAPLALAQCCEAIGDLANAGSHYSVALSLRPEDPRVLEAAARYYLKRKQAAQARSTLRALCALETAIPEKTLAWANSELRKLSAGSP